MSASETDAQRLSLYWITRITGTLTLAPGAVSTHGLASELQLVPSQAHPLLLSAKEAGLIESVDVGWRLTPRGAEIGAFAAEARDRARASEVGQVARSYTEFLPNGREHLA